MSWLVSNRQILLCGSNNREWLFYQPPAYLKKMASFQCDLYEQTNHETHQVSWENSVNASLDLIKCSFRFLSYKNLNVNEYCVLL